MRVAVKEVERGSVRDPVLLPKTKATLEELASKSEEAIPTRPCAATTCPMILTRGPIAHRHGTKESARRKSPEPTSRTAPSPSLPKSS